MAYFFSEKFALNKNFSCLLMHAYAAVNRSVSYEKLSYIKKNNQFILFKLFQKNIHQIISPPQDFFSKEDRKLCTFFYFMN